MRKGKFYIKTFGCQMNELDSELVRRMMEERGYEYTDDPKEADFVLINTCTVREKAARKAKHLLRYFSKREKTTVVMGCLAQQEKGKLLKWGADLVVGTRAFVEIPDLLENLNGSGVVCEEIGLHYRTDRRLNPGQYSAYVSIQYGCDNFCTFCVVPYTRGREYSRPAHEIVEEIKNLDSQGVVEITLLGQNVNSYHDGKYDFADLLKLVEDTIRNIKRVRFTSPNPRDFSYKVLKVVAESDVITPWIHLPLQSGSDRILRKMNRGYTKAEYLDQAAMIRDLMPYGTITTDIIVGFPGETEEDFEETLDVVRRVKYDGAYMFIYSPRPNTPAARYSGQVPYEVKLDRQRRLIDEVNRGIYERRRLFLGREGEVLIDGLSRKDPSESAGKLFNGLTVTVNGRYKPGTFVKVRINGIQGLTLKAEPLVVALR
ncbi:MAG: tRNA (N6-isopentenyl adenosine(37)-C2)-methylthiotransferase MiaB [Thermotogae bacterium]|nr:tRNA (N6-isopentenyl adenosine(37)-C2)-methylthiotransferase MiaB [Thermotogota bacterium]